MRYELFLLDRVSDRKPCICTVNNEGGWEKEVNNTGLTLRTATTRIDCEWRWGPAQNSHQRPF